jgi:hypothetical protein
MTRHKSIPGALLLCALAVCVFGAAGAQAEGLTAYTCTEGAGTLQYKDSHCLEESATGAFTTIAIPINTPTEVTGESVGEVRLKATVALTKVEVKCLSTMSTGILENVVEGGTMKAHGKEGVQHYSGCSGNLQTNAEKKCNIEPITGGGAVGTINTTALTAITSFDATHHYVTVSPEAGGVFTEFKFIQTTGGTCPAVLVGVKLTATGSVRGEIPTSPHSHITASGTAGGNLKMNGAVAEVEATTRGTMVGTEKTIGGKTA